MKILAIVAILLVALPVLALAVDRVLLMFECEHCFTRHRAVYPRPLRVRGRRVFLHVCRRCAHRIDAGMERSDWSGHRIGRQ